MARILLTECATTCFHYSVGYVSQGRARPGKEGAAVKLKVLVVDDEPGIHRLLEKALEKEGCEVVSAESGHDAVDIADGWSPDMLFLDMQMPGMDGTEALRRIRERGTEPVTVMMTAFPDREARANALQLGACGCIPKPFGISLIRLLVRRTAAMKKAARRYAGAHSPMTPTHV